MSDRQPDIVEVTKGQTKAQVKEPPMFRVILFNDDYTTKEFVVEILVLVFHKSAAEATALMWQVHRHGSGVAGVYAREIAETKATTVTTLARENGFPLKVGIEPDP